MEVSIKDILRSDRILQHTQELTLNNDSKRVFSVAKQQIEVGGETCYMVLMHENTASHELKEQQAELESIKFSNSCISDQILEPLRVIDQYIEILYDQLKQRPDTRKITEAIKNCSRLIQFQIMDLRDIASIANQKFQVHLKIVDIHAAIDETINANQPQAQLKKQKLRCIIDNSMPRHIKTDSNRLQQVVNNLVCNAIKFNDAKTRIQVEFYFIEEENLIQVNVTDSGVPLSEKEAARIFNLKKVSDTDNLLDGPGIGLFICKRLIAEMGGTILLRTDIPKRLGTKSFILTLPA